MTWRAISARPYLQRRLDSVTGEYREYKCGMEAMLDTANVSASDGAASALSSADRLHRVQLERDAAAAAAQHLAAQLDGLDRKHVAVGMSNERSPPRHPPHIVPVLAATCRATAIHMNPRLFR